MRQGSEFVAELRRGIDAAQRAVSVAEQAGHPHEAHLHRARLQDLLEVAGRHGVDTSSWLDPGIRQALDDDRTLTDPREPQ